MGGMGSSTATIGNEVTDDPNATPEAKKAARAKLSAQFGLTDPNPPPAPAPNLADQLLKKAGADSLTTQAKTSRKSSFLTGAMGDVTDPLIKKKLGSY